MANETDRSHRARLSDGMVADLQFAIARAGLEGVISAHYRSDANVVRLVFSTGEIANALDVPATVEWVARVSRSLPKVAEHRRRTLPGVDEQG